MGKRNGELMTLVSGDHSIGPANGQLTINTYVGGIGAKMGHDLVLEAKRWDGTATIDATNPAASSVHVRVEVDSLEVLRATGGLKPLTDHDKADIMQNRDKTLQAAKYAQIVFDSTAVAVDSSSLSLEGNLTIMGATRPVTLDVAVDDTDGAIRITGKTRFLQTDFGVKPYSKMGALKVKDEIDMNIVLTLPRA